MGMMVIVDEEGIYYLDQEKDVEGLVKVSKLRGVKVSKLPYPVEG